MIIPTTDTNGNPLNELDQADVNACCAQIDTFDLLKVAAQKHLDSILAAASVHFLESNPTTTVTPTPTPITSPNITIPPATSITDNAGSTITIDSDGKILRDGNQIGSGAGSIASYNPLTHTLYVLGTDGQWYKLLLDDAWQGLGLFDSTVIPTV